MANYQHIFISGRAETELFRTPPTRGGQLNIPQRERLSHSATLLNRFDAIWEQQQQLNQQRQAAQVPTRDGTYLSFTSSVDYDLITKSLEDLRKGIRLLNVQSIVSEDEHKQVRATIYLPRGKESHFIDKIRRYQTENTRRGDPKNASLVNSIEDVSLSLLESLWTDKAELLPDDHSKWCEVWLNVNTKEQKEQEQIALFEGILERIRIEHKPNCIIFPERAVLLINANRNQLIELMAQSNLLAEFRAGQEPAGFWVNKSAVEQQSRVEDLLSRITVIDSNVKVCVLDTGVNNGHQLLQPLLDNNNALTVNPNWGTHDHERGSGHGTLMAGVAGYGELERALAAGNDVTLSHKLCSVKILPPPSQDGTPKELWGDITQQGIARAEIQNPNTNLVYCMAVTSMEDIDRGRPSSWSGAIDNVTFGDGNGKKLVVISAGNISPDNWTDYPNSNLVSSVQNPAQSWNALTVGAYTEKVTVNDKNYANHTPLANVGELSPHSTASLAWEKIWPFKPDVVFEGGNLLKTPDNSVIGHEDLELLSTSKSFNIKPFDTINATSAATAKASWFAAKIAYLYPDIWAETVRGLIVHSANWNASMLNQLGVRQNNKSDYKNVLKVFGYGVPDLDSALYSRESALTFIAEESIQPFRFNENNQPATNQIHIFNLPWAEELLLNLGNIPAKLKITLSYFIQPGAGETGWKDKYRYQSYGLRFDVNNSNEDLDAFRRRINAAARDEEDEVRSGSGSERWKLGKNSQKNGSIHSDVWEGTAADLATCHYIAVYPVIGWWRERKHLGKVESQTRYSLIISLETPTQDVELYTIIRNMIEVPVEIQISE
jgi:hypothetical protein